MNNENFLTVKEAATRLRLHPHSVRKLIKSGQIEALRVNRMYRVLPDGIERFQNEQAPELVKAEKTEVTP